MSAAAKPAVSAPAPPKASAAVKTGPKGVPVSAKLSAGPVSVTIEAKSPAKKQVTPKKPAAKPAAAASPKSPNAPKSPFAAGAQSRFSEAKSRRSKSNPGSPSSPNKNMTMSQQYLEEVRRNMEKRGRYTPGPGNYEHKSTFARAAARGKPVGSLASIRQDTTMKGPGPGQYESKVNIGVGKKYSFGNRIRGREKNIPGPGEYNFKSTFARANAQGKAVGGKASKHSKISADAIANPGPGQYNSKSKIGAATSFTCGSRRFDASYYNP